MVVLVTCESEDEAVADRSAMFFDSFPYALECSALVNRNNVS